MNTFNELTLLRIEVVSSSLNKDQIVVLVPYLLEFLLLFHIFSMIKHVFRKKRYMIFSVAISFEFRDLHIRDSTWIYVSRSNDM